MGRWQPDPDMELSRSSACAMLFIDEVGNVYWDSNRLRADFWDDLAVQNAYSS